MKNSNVVILTNQYYHILIKTLVCIICLAVGMTCFALSTLWLRYIESFEDLVPDAERVFLVGVKQSPYNYGLSVYHGVGVSKDHSPIGQSLTLWYKTYDDNHEEHKKYKELRVADVVQTPSLNDLCLNVKDEILVRNGEHTYLMTDLLRFT